MAAVKRKQFSLEEKKTIISEVEKGMKKSDVARKYGISPSTLSTFLKDKESILKKLQVQVFDPSRKRIRNAQFQDVDSAVYKWFMDVRSRNIPLSGPLIREKGMKFARMLNIENFQASVGWLNRFRERYGIVAKCISGEAKDVPVESVNEWRKGEIVKLMKTYSPNDVFNADEAGIFFQLEPRKTLALKGDKCIGGKLSKQRITALFCCNKLGTEKRKVLIIGKSEKPRCFKNFKSLPCIYKANKKSWMTQGFFNEWLINFDKDMQKQKRKILLLIDNCTAHNEPPILNHIRVEYFPPNCTAILQPLDQGIIRAVKSRYKTMLLKRILCDLQNNVNRKCNMKEAIDMICGSWDDISQKTIAHCWKHAQIDQDLNKESTAQGSSDVLHDEEQTVEYEIESIWNSVKEKSSVSQSISFKDFLTADDNAVTCYSLTETDIVQSIVDDRILENDEESSEDEENEVITSKVTSAEALESLERVRNFISLQSSVPDNIFSNINHVHNFVLSAASNSLVQKKITDFLH